MTGFLRSRQTGMPDLSARLLPESIVPSIQSRHGINSRVSCLAYDPVQSLLAIGTLASPTGPGCIYVLGGGRVQRVFNTPRAGSAGSLFLGNNRLITLTQKGDLVAWDLATGALITTPSSVPSNAVCFTSDPSLDWALLGLRNGEVLAYDLANGLVSATFRLPNFWREHDPQCLHSSPVLSLAFHPRDLGQLLIGHPQGAVVYSFKQNKPISFLQYILPPGAPGGSGTPGGERKPHLCDALWHPLGNFVLTVHQDGSLVFWDVRETKVLQARTVSTININLSSASSRLGAAAYTIDSVLRVAWCCRSNPSSTSLIIAGGHSPHADESGISVLDFGPSPIYQTSTWQMLEDHFLRARMITLPLPDGTRGRDFVVLPQSSPYSAGAQDPVAVIILLSSDELVTLSYPSGHPISPFIPLHPSLSLVHPYATRMDVAVVTRDQWLPMVEFRAVPEQSFLLGGASADRPRRRFDDRIILLVAHANGGVRAWDAGRKDFLENDSQLYVNVRRSLGRVDDVVVSAMSMAPATGEVAVGTTCGEVLVYRWGRKKITEATIKSVNPMSPLYSNPGGITDIAHLADPALIEGLQPTVLYEMMQGPVCALRFSDVGFLAVGSEAGIFSLVDLRGPKVICQGALGELAREKRSSFLGRSATSRNSPLLPPGSPGRAVVCEFGVLTVDGDSYSSIVCFVGTSSGRVFTFKILPSPGGGFSTALAGCVSLSDSIVSISPVMLESGQPATATAKSVQGLQAGEQTDGVLVVVSRAEVRIFKPATAKGTAKTFEAKSACAAAGIVELDLRGCALLCLFADGSVRAFSLPSLRELTHATLPAGDFARISEAVVTRSGHVVLWTSPGELCVLYVWDTAAATAAAVSEADTLINPGLTQPARPSISNLEWISGTQYISSVDLDLLIGGPGRLPASRTSATATSRTVSPTIKSPISPAAKGWTAYLSRQINERTEQLTGVGDSMDNLQSSSQAWTEDVGKYLAKKKRSLLWGAAKSRLT